MAQENLAAAIREKYGFAVDIPEYLEEIQLETGVQVETVKKPPIEVPQVNLDLTLDELKAKIDQINSIRQKMRKLPLSQQVEIWELLKEADRRFSEIRARL